MVLAFTEEQKKEIEARGMTVIEFKRRLRNMGKTIDDAWQILMEMAEKITKAWNTFKEKFLEAVDSIKMAVETILDRYGYPVSRRYRIVKAFSKCTGTPFSFGWKFTYKIHKWFVWLARRYC